jgi:hypothetical protein
LAKIKTLDVSISSCDWKYPLSTETEKRELKIQWNEWKLLCERTDLKGERRKNSSRNVPFLLIDRKHLQQKVLRVESMNYYELVFSIM